MKLVLLPLVTILGFAEVRQDPYFLAAKNTINSKFPAGSIALNHCIEGFNSQIVALEQDSRLSRWVRYVSGGEPTFKSRLVVRFEYRDGGLKSEELFTKDFAENERRRTTDFFDAEMSNIAEFFRDRLCRNLPKPGYHPESGLFDDVSRDSVPVTN